MRRKGEQLFCTEEIEEDQQKPPKMGSGGSKILRCYSAPLLPFLPPIHSIVAAKTVTVPYKSLIKARGDH